MFKSMSRSPEFEMTTRIGYSLWPRLRRTCRSPSSGKPIDIRSISSVFLPTIKASPSERISRRRYLSKGEVNPEGVFRAVDTLPSSVMAKFKITRGRGIGVSTFGVQRSAFNGAFGAVWVQPRFEEAKQTFGLPSILTAHVKRYAIER
jgi:hypothetical protein